MEQKSTDLQVIAAMLGTAIAAGCDDLATCAASPCCPLPFTDLAHGDHHADS